MKYSRSALVFFLPLCLADSGLSQGKKLGVEDFLKIPILSSPRFSPDGKRIVYQRIRRDLKKNVYKRTIHLVLLEEKKDIRLTGGNWNDWGAFFSRDGKKLYFLSDRGGKVALYSNLFDGSDPKAVFRRKGGFSNLKFSPDRKYAAFLAGPKGKRSRGRDPEVWRDLEDKSRWPRLWIRDMKTGKERMLTRDDVYVYDFDWSPDGKRIAFTADPKGSSEVTEDHFLGLVDLEGNVEMLSDLPAHHAMPKFSPDG